MVFKENLAKLKKADSINKIDLYKNGQLLSTIENIEGKKGSLQVYANLVGFDNGSIDYLLAQKGIEIFAEHVESAKQKPGTHPNVDILLNLTNKESLKAIIHYNVPIDLKERVAHFVSLKKSGELLKHRTDALITFNEVMDLLESGHLRTAQFINGTWRAEEWVKEGIMLGFPLGNIVVYNSGSDISFADKETFPLRKISADLGFRVVPPASGLRRGAFAGSGAVFMPPAYVNVGAHVSAGTMVESLAGSCCQIGRDSHISAGAIIGGVLDPIEATPVILGDNVLLGEGSGITQGSRLGDLTTLAPGVHISKATPIIDPINGVAYTSKGTTNLKEFRMGDAKLYGVGEIIAPKDNGFGPEIPRGALIIPGLSMSSNGIPKLTPMIAKYIENANDRAYALEEALRN